MRNTVRSIGMSLASMAGILLVSGVAWAQAEETPIAVRLIGCHPIEDPERREWVDEDGIVHVRDHLFSCSSGRDMVGEIIAWANWDHDPAAGHHSEHGYYSFAGSILGEPATGVGRYTKERNRIEGVWTSTQEDVMHLAGGGLVILSGTWESGDRIIIFWGTLLETPGGAKRNGPPRRK
jgi:hypothetical protein